MLLHDQSEALGSTGVSDSTLPLGFTIRLDPGGLRAIPRPTVTVTAATTTPASSAAARAVAAGLTEAEDSLAALLPVQANVLSEPLADCVALSPGDDHDESRRAAQCAAEAFSQQLTANEQQDLPIGLLVWHALAEQTTSTW